MILLVYLFHIRQVTVNVNYQLVVQKQLPKNMMVMIGPFTLKVLKTKIALNSTKTTIGNTMMIIAVYYITLSANVKIHAVKVKRTVNPVEQGSMPLL